jgi:transposase, IS30 family
MSYSDLSTTERFKLYQHRTTDKLTLGQIATQMKRSKSTISRELKRNSIDGKLYLPDTAQTKMQARRAQSKQKFMSISASTLEQVKQRLHITVHNNYRDA